MFHAAAFDQESGVWPRGIVGWLARRWPELAGVATVLAVTASILTITPLPDVAWQLWIAHQLRLGARLYVDIIETNPPLWFWQAMPLDWAAAAVGVRAHALLVAWIGIAAAISLWWTGRLIDHLPARWRAGLLVYAALTLVQVPLLNAGQREQWVLIGFLPYVALVVARQEGRRVSPPLAAAIGLAAFMGLALKHYFLFAPVLLELWLLLRLRAAYRPIRPETAALALAGLAYAVAIVAVTPEFVTRIVPLDRIAYGRIGAQDLGGMWRRTQTYWVIAASLLFLERRLVGRAPHAVPMLFAALGFGLAWLVQFRGFPNHSVPTTGFLALALAFFAVENRGALSKTARALAAAALLLPIGYFAAQGSYRDLSAPTVRRLLVGVPANRSVAFITYESDVAWPMSLDRPAPYPSRHYGMWIMLAVGFDRGHTPALAQIGRTLVEDTAQDYRCAQPVRILISRMPVYGLRLTDWFMASPSFAGVMSHYRPLGTREGFDIYELKAPFARPPAAACRRSF